MKHETYMHRALQLARNGEGRVAPNPLVGAVIVADDRIIGEGYHACYGGPHAEVNAINSVNPQDRHLLKESTIYVSLEPCAHFGKTPPCANLIVDTGIPNVVIASPDSNPKVAGKGVKILRDAGINVTECVLREEADKLNRRFLTFQTKKRPWILLKWAQSADSFMADIDSKGKPIPVKFSNPLSQVWMHRERANVQAIMVGRNTERIDQPLLTNRLWGGVSPEKIECLHNCDIKKLLEDLYQRGISSLMIEGGPELLISFINGGFYDEIRIEEAPIILTKGLPAPSLPLDIIKVSSSKIRDNNVAVYQRK